MDNVSNPPTSSEPPQPLDHAQVLRQIYSRTSHVVWLASFPTWQLLDINAAGQALLGVSHAESPGQSNWLDSIVEHEREHVSKTVQGLVPGDIVELFCHVRDATGEVRLLKGDVLRLESNGAQLVAGVATIVDQAGAEEIASLHASREMLRRLLEDIPMRVLRKDTAGRIVYANERFCQSIQRSFLELEGKTAYEVFPANIARKYTEDDRHVLETGETIEKVQTQSSADGSSNYVQVIKGPVRNDRGAIVGVQVIFRDVTAQKRAESQLFQERNLLRALLDSVEDSIYFKDTSSRFIRVSRGLATKFRLDDPQQAIGKSDGDFFAAKHAEAAWEDEVTLMRGGESVIDKTERETWHDGRDTWCLTTKKALRDEDGNVIGTLGISRDITEQKRQEEKLQREHHLLRAIVDNVPDLIFAKDRAGRFVLANRALLKVLGADSFGDVIGKTDYDFFPPELACEFVADDQSVMRSGRPLLDQEETHELDGQRTVMLTSKVPLRNGSDEVWGIVGIARDISSRIHQQEQLEEALQVADNASQAKSDFLANMSHEIRTPLNAIIGMTDLVLQSELEAEQQEFLSMVQASGNTLLKVINDILDFSKIEAGKLELDRGEFDLRAELGATVKSLAHSASEKGLELHLRIRPNVPQVFYSDAIRLRQVIVNLVANAIKFTDRGEIVVEVQCRGVASGRAKLQFSVTDTGIGIPKEKYETIFDEFQQADTSTTRRYGGTGLGLSISSQLVNLLGGRLRVTSREGSGSMFYFSLDLEIRTGESLRTPVVVGGTSVLIVDDNRTNRIILEEVLQGWGMLPDSAESVEAAKAKLLESEVQAEPFQMLLCDVNMPVEDGFSLVSWLRQHDEFARLPVIMLTSGRRLGDAQRREALRIEGQLMKPVQQSDLFDAIVTSLGNGSAEAVSSRSTGSEVGRVAALRILLVEDSYFNQRLALSLLGRDNHEVAVANNGVEALAEFDTSEFDLILMDVQMPELDGIETTEAIRRREQLGASPSGTRRTPIIAMTAHAMEEDRARCLQAGMDAYITKPIDPDSFYQAIAELASQSKGDVARLGFEQPGQSDLEENGSTLDNSLLRGAEFNEEKDISEDSLGERPRSVDSDGIVDFDLALQRAGNSPRVLAALAEVLRGELPNLLSQIDKAITERDSTTLRRIAHTVKGNAKHFHAQRVSALAQKLGAFGETATLEDALAVFQDLKVESQLLLRELEGYRFQ